jgi:hypothetical protein
MSLDALISFSGFLVFGCTSMVKLQRLITTMYTFDIFYSGVATLAFSRTVVYFRTELAALARMRGVTSDKLSLDNDKKGSLTRSSEKINKN